MRPLAFGAIVLLLLGTTHVACSKKSGGSSSGGSGSGAAPLAAPPADWPADSASIVAQSSYADPVGDLTLDHPGAKPPALVQYPEGDVTRLAMGVQGSYLYVRLEVASVIPSAPVSVPAQNGVPAQRATSQSMSVAVDIDSDDRTGGGASPWVEGVDLFFAISLKYGGQSHVYANYDFEGGDLHKNRGQLLGELGEGGPGHDFVVVRYDLSRLPAAFSPVGKTVEFGSWHESESDDFHEMATDTLAVRSDWTLP